MRLFPLILTLVILTLAPMALAQLPAPNDAGVAMGHLHLNVKDMEVSKKFWVDQLGANVVKLGQMDAMKFPGAIILLRKADPTGGTEGSSVNHIGFLVRDLDKELAKWKANSVQVVSENKPGRQVFLMSPDGVKIEIYEDKSIAAPIVNHHIHFWTGSVEDTQAWYVKTFSAKPGKRGKFEAADVPGVNLSFTKAETPVVGTKGRALDHIGFEVKDLEAFCKKLEASGVKFDVPYRKVPALGLSIAFFTDPWGTYIELTEGLSRL
jgi:catechol 2,3-dioxygenase-like lactoylglutathione lyase family enzyme